MPITSKIRVDIADITGNGEYLDSFAVFRGINLPTLKDFTKSEKQHSRRQKKLEKKMKLLEKKIDETEDDQKLEMYEKQEEELQDQLDEVTEKLLSSTQRFLKECFVAGQFVENGNKRDMTEDDIIGMDLLTMKKIFGKLTGDNDEKEKKS